MRLNGMENPNAKWDSPGLMQRSGRFFARKSFRLCRFLLVLLLAVWIPASSVAASAGAIWPTNDATANTAGRWPSLAELQCAAYIVVNRSSGQVLIEKQPDVPLYPASTTKVLTALLVLEKLDLNAVVTVSAEAIKMPAGSSKVGYKAGEIVIVKDMLAGMMLASGNDAANAFAEAISGTQAQFAVLMNERAHKAGAVNSNFMNPSGTHHDQHVATARDLALITAEAMKNPTFRSLIALENCSLPATNMHPLNGWSVLNNTNRLMIFDDTYFRSDWIKSVTGVKTGSTTMAGECLIASATTTTGAELIGVILKASVSVADSNKFVSMRTLLEEGAKKAGGNVSPTTSATTGTTGTTGTMGTTSATNSSATASGATTIAGTSTVAPSAGGTTSISTQPTVTTRVTENTPAGAGVLEDLRIRFGIDQPTFLLAALVIGVLLGVLGGLVMVLSLFRVTNRRSPSVSGRRAKRR